MVKKSVVELLKESFPEAKNEINEMAKLINELIESNGPVIGEQGVTNSVNDCVRLQANTVFGFSKIINRLKNDTIADRNEILRLRKIIETMKYENNTFKTHNFMYHEEISKLKEENEVLKNTIAALEHKLNE